MDIISRSAIPLPHRSNLLLAGWSEPDKRKSQIWTLSQRDGLVAPAFGGYRYGFGPGARSQFSEQGFDMEFHGVQRDVQSARDRLVGHAFGERRQHVEFPRSEKCVTIGLAHRAEAGIHRIGQADDQAGGNRSYRR